MLVTLLATAVVLGVLILVHELGHFWAAKAVDIEVPRFSIGLGPKVAGFRKGETEYVLSAVPLGGYVKMAGMADEEATGVLEGGAEPRREPSPRDFEAKSLGARTLVICAGVAMNLVFAFVAFALVAGVVGVSDEVVSRVEPGSAAEAAGFRTGDRIVRIDGEKVREAWQIPALVQPRAEREVSFLVEREGRRLRLEAVPERTTRFQELTGDTVSVGYLGIAFGEERPVGWSGAIAVGATRTVDWCVLVVEFLADLVTGETSARELGGPIMIGQISGEAARAGVWSLLQFMAIISVNLAILNLLPIPVLDGGHLLFLAVEGLRGRALSVEQRIRWSQVGLVVVMGIMIWAIGNDILRLFGM